MPQSVLEQIKNKLDIVEVISGYIKLKKVGANYRAMSPFHQESNPSFFVSPSKQIWHDFSAGTGGDMFRFVMAIEGIEFKEALKILATKAGIELKYSKQYKEIKNQKDILVEILQLATRFYQHQLENSTNGGYAKKYLLSRGIEEDIIKKYQIGYAPDTWSYLVEYLEKKGYKNNDIEKSGLATRNKRGGFNDKFRGRIMFPIADLNSLIVGFTGRILTKTQEEKGMAKYMNTPNTLVYDKSRILYGIDNAKLPIIKNDLAILVEGQMDQIMSYQSGVENVVAISGTALTEYHLMILKRYTKNLVIAFDMDLGGNSATDRSIKMALAQGFNVKTINLEQGQDPADIVREDKEKWKKIVLNTQSVMDFYFKIALGKFDKTNIDGKKGISDIILPAIARIPNAIERTHWISILSDEIKIAEIAITEELRKYSDKQEKTEIKVPIIKKEIQDKKTRRDMLEERITAILFKNKEEIKVLKEDDYSYFSENIASIIEGIRDKKEFNTEETEGLNKMVFLMEIEYDGSDPKDITKELEESLKELRILVIKNKMSEISSEIKNLEKENNIDEVKKLCDDLQKLSRKILN